MEFERIKQLETIEFDGVTITLTKFKNMKTVAAFKDETLPILISQLKPLEVFLAAIMNEFAPLKDWGILDAMIIAEKDIDKCLMPALRVMLGYYLPDNNYTAEHLSSKVYDLEWLYEVVMSQMKLERLLEYHLRRKLSFIMDLNEFAKLGINMDGWTSKAESMIKAAVQRQRPDREFVLPNGR